MSSLTEMFLRFRDWRVWCGYVGKLGGRPPLLCVPGGPGMPHDYIATLAQLADERAVIFYDPLGSGCSDKPSDVSWTLELYAEELLTICRALKALNVGPIHLLSHSMASLIVLKALEQPLPSLRSVVLASPLVDVPLYLRAVRRRVESITDDFAAFMQAERDPSLRATPEFARTINTFVGRHICRRAPAPKCLSRGIRLVNRAAHAQMKSGYLFYLTPMAELDMSQQLAALTVPTLLTCGEHDPTSPDDCRTFQSRAPHCQVAVVPGCSHMPHLENSVAYANVVRSFLRSVDQSSQS